MKSYLKTALRNLWKNRGYSALNIAGLAVGIACATLIFLWVEDEVTFDRQFANRDVLYRVYQNQVHDGSVFTSRVTPGLLANALLNEVPGIKNATRMTNGTSRVLLSEGEKAFYEKGNYVDSAFFSMFNLHFIYGDGKTALHDLHGIVVTARVAEKFFGAENPLGKSLKMDNGELFTVTGVVDNLATNASFQFDWLARFDLVLQKFEWMNRWNANGVATLVELYPDADASAVNNHLTHFLKTKDAKLDTECFLFPMTRWHLYDHFNNGQPDGEGQIRYLKLFTLIAWIILVIACINFMNLATARSEQRAKEVGVRKALGAAKRILIFQFITESMVLSFVSVMLALAIVLLVLPSFNALVGKSLAFHWNSPVHLGGLAIIAITCGLLAGSYPAFYLSSFNPVHVLKGLKLRTSASAGFVRRGLVIVQFVVSIVLMTATIVIYQQIHYTRHRDLGYDKEQTLYLDVRGTLNDHFHAVRNDLVNTGVVENAALSMNPVLQLGWYSSDDYSWAGKDPQKNVLITTEGVSPEYISTVGMTLTEGRDFDTDATTDIDHVIVNQTMANLLHNGSVVGEEIMAGSQRLKIIGVVKDFVSGNMYSRSQAPVILTCNPSPYNFMTIRLKRTSDLTSTLAAVEKVIRVHNPEYPFEYHFVDEAFDKLFSTEVLVEKLSGVFGALAIFISCLGLFGLAAYTAQRRSKEIGIRKILGSSVQDVTVLITSGYLKLVAVSFVLAFPLAGWLMNRWLESYEYRAPLSWWMFALVGIGTLVITVLTVSFQTLRAARVNPTDVIRNE